MTAMDAKAMVNCRLRKEMQVLWPVGVFILAFGPFSAYFMQDRDEGVMGICLLLWILVCALLASMSFGHEFSHHTIASLLAQPIPRQRIWREKHLATALVLGAAVAWIWGWNHSIGDKGWFFLIAAALTFLTAPTLTLLSRNALAGPVFTFAVPFILLLMVQGITTHFHGQWLAQQDPALPPKVRVDQVFSLVCGAVGAIYVSAVYLLGSRFFRRMQVAGSGESVAAPQFSWLTYKPTAAEHQSAPRRGLFRSLYLKELRLQQFSFVFTGVFLAVLAVLVTFKTEHPNAEDYYLIALGVFMPLIGVIPGSMAIAGERQMGTLQGQLITPVSCRKQWMLKCLMAIGLTYFLGLLVPSVSFSVCETLSQSFARGINHGWDGLSIIASIYYVLGITVSLYASSFSGTPLRALLSACGMVLLGWMVGAVVLHAAAEQESWFREQLGWWAQSALHDPDSLLWWIRAQFKEFGVEWGPSVWIIGYGLTTLSMLGFIGLTARFGYENFRRANVARRALQVQFAILGAYLVLTVMILGSLAVVFDLSMRHLSF